MQKTTFAGKSQHMNRLILQEEAQAYIQDHLKSDLTKLILKGSPFENITIQELAGQIESRNRCEKKLPQWFQTPGIYFPSRLAIEQASSEFTAKYKASLLCGEKLPNPLQSINIQRYFFVKKKYRSNKF